MYFYGKDVCESLKEKLAKQVLLLKQKNLIPTLAILQLTDDESLEIYYKTRQRIADELGIRIKLLKLSNISYRNIKTTINLLNCDENIWGIMVDTPIPSSLNYKDVISLIDPKKDVEGLSWNDDLKEKYSKKGISTPVAKAVLETMNFYGLNIKNKRIIILGNSVNVGKPIGQLLSNNGALCFNANSKTADIKNLIKNSDYVIAAINKKEFLTKEFFQKNSVIFDIGVHYDEFGKICGDVKKDVYDFVKDICPSPKGIGPVTNVCLFDNLLKLKEI